MIEVTQDGQGTDNLKVQSSSYRSIFKATSLFGGLQVYLILISIIKQKIIAVLLGPLGVGIMGLYTSATQLIQSTSSCGLSQSAVKDVSESYTSGDNNRIAIVFTVLRRLVWITGLLGLLLVCIFSKQLSISTFGNNDYIVPFVFLSFTLLIDQLSSGQKVILQGTRHLKDLAKSSALGATFGFLLSIPFFFVWGINGIVPFIILNSIVSLIFTWLFSRRVITEKVFVDTKTTLKEGKGMLKMGIAMSISGILVYLSSYILRAFIRSEGGLDAVGLYTAGFSLMTTYSGLVFNAMSTDYYPRLASINTDNVKCKEVMNQQAEVGLLIVAPLMAACIIFIPVVVRILFSSEFLGASGYIIWCALGMLFKVASWSISFIFVAKGESKLFIANELAFGVYTLVFNFLGYYWGGLVGLGVSFSIGYFIYTLQVYLISYKRYRIIFSNSFLSLFIIQFLIVLTCLLVMYSIQSLTIKYALGFILVLLSVVFTLKGLDNRLNIRSIIKNRIFK